MFSMVISANADMITKVVLVSISGSLLLHTCMRKTRLVQMPTLAGMMPTNRGRYGTN